MEAQREASRHLLACIDLDGGPMGRAASLAQAERVIRAIVAGRHDRPSLVARIVGEVGAEIVEAVIPPGHDLNTVELARRYRTSRTPVREALMLLENEGLVDIPPRRRPRAHVPSIKELREIYRTRAAIFDVVAADLAERATPEDIELLKGILARMERAAGRGDAVAYTWLNVAFHDADTRMSGNRTAKRIHDSLLLRTLRVRRLSMGRLSRMRRSLEDHVQLVKAYENHDATLASAILRANHMATFAAVEQYLRETGAPTGDDGHDAAGRPRRPLELPEGPRRRKRADGFDPGASIT